MLPFDLFESLFDGARRRGAKYKGNGKFTFRSERDAREFMDELRDREKKMKGEQFWFSPGQKEQKPKMGKYGPIYGTDPALWVQTKPFTGKRFRPEKGHWMAIPHTLDDIRKYGNLETIEVLL